MYSHGGAKHAPFGLGAERVDEPEGGLLRAHATHRRTPRLDEPTGLCVLATEREKLLAIEDRRRLKVSPPGITAHLATIVRSDSVLDERFVDEHEWAEVDKA